MNWFKKGLIYVAQGKNGFDASHCHKPSPIKIDSKTIRLFFGVRDKENKTRTTFIDIDSKNFNIKYVHDKITLDLGKIGTFDDSGSQVCSVIKDKNEFFMYYIGWNTSTTVPSRNSLGLASSTDGINFSRVYEGPILERFKNEAYHIGASDVLLDDGIWKMWYNCGNGIRIINGRPEYTLLIKYATSTNGIDWKREDIVCISPNTDDEIIGRPSVIKENGLYKMWFSRRSINGFRNNPLSSYRAGYAESMDGIKWIRKDELVGIDVSNDSSSWDSQMIAYPYVIKVEGKLVMFYNGNGFGKTGVGYAVYE